MAFASVINVFGRDKIRIRLLFSDISNTIKPPYLHIHYPRNSSIRSFDFVPKFHIRGEKVRLYTVNITPALLSPSVNR